MSDIKRKGDRGTLFGAENNFHPPDQQSIWKDRRNGVPGELDDIDLKARDERNINSLFKENNNFSPKGKRSEWARAYSGDHSVQDKFNFEKQPSQGKALKGKEKSKLIDVDYKDLEPDISSSPISGLYRPSRPSVQHHPVPSNAPPPPEPILSAPYTDAPATPPPSAAQAPVNSANARDNEEEAKYLALALAEDFARKGGLIMVGDALYYYTGVFYKLLREDEAQRLFFKQYRNVLARASTVAVLRNAAVLLRFCVNKVYEEFPVNQNLIVFPNGTLEVDTGRFRANSPDDLATSALAINYDRDRTEMPWTEYFLNTIANGDTDLYSLMLEVIGYILSNDTKGKSFFYLEGVGDAGKSRFCDLIASFFPVSGANKVSRIALQDLDGKYALGNLVNAKLNISEDLPDTPLSPTAVSRIKMISDGNRLEAEAKYVQPFSFRPVCKMLFASNHPLRIKEPDDAFTNRVVYIPFRNHIPKDKQDKQILEKMQAELPALFNHALQAYQRLVENNYQWAGAEKLKPDIVVTNSSLAEDRIAVLRRFLRDCCELAIDATTPTSDLQRAYEHFCYQNTFLPIVGDRFSRELAAVLPNTVTRTKIGNQKRGFKGIRLKPVLKNYPTGQFVEEPDV